MGLITMGAMVAGACLLRSEFEKTQLQLRRFELESDKLPENFDGVRIAVLSDLHNNRFGKDNQVLFSMLRAIEPDYIMSAGDMILKTKPMETDDVAQFLGSLTRICPVYCGNGNHELTLRKEPAGAMGITAYDRYVRHLRLLGVTVLEDRTEEIERDGQTICVTGLDLGLKFYAKGKHVSMAKDYIESKVGPADREKFQILIGHYPNYFNEYAAWGANLVLAGHMHGGTVQLPGLGGLMSPNYEFFPSYDKGLFKRKHSAMLVSPGLGTHSVNIRIGGNYPEVALIVLRKKK